MLIENKVNENKKGISLKNILGVSIACLSLFVTVGVNQDVVHASSTHELIPEVITAVKHPKPVAPQKPASGQAAARIQKEAIKHVGVPYVWGGTTTRGFDCSGFTQYAFRDAGIKLPRVARDQAVIDKNGPLASRTQTIWSKSSVKPGDLVFFSNSPGRVSHVGIALPNNKYIHASSSRRAIAIATRGGSFYNGKFTKAIRIND